MAILGALCLYRTSVEAGGVGVRLFCALTKKGGSTGSKGLASENFFGIIGLRHCFAKQRRDMSQEPKPSTVKHVEADTAGVPPSAALALLALLARGRQ